MDDRATDVASAPELYTSTTRRFAAAVIQDRIDELSAVVDTGTAVRHRSADGAPCHTTTTGDALPDLPSGFRSLGETHHAAARATADSVYERSVAPDDAVELLARIRAGARRQSADVTFVQVRFEEFAQCMTVSRPGEEPRQDTRRRVRTVVRTTATRTGTTRTSSLMTAASGWDELLERVAADCPGRRAAELATGLLTADPLPDGELPVVFAGSTGAALIHEVCGHALEGDLLADRRSLFADRSEPELASAVLTVLDDPRLGGWGSYEFDDEGTPARPVALVEAGRLTGQVTCRESAHRLGVPASGHARRIDYQQPPLPRLSNTSVRAGAERPDALLSGIGHGVLVTEVAGGHVNPMTGEFTVQVTTGRAIRDGKPAEPLGSGTVRGNVRTALAAIKAVADDVSVSDAVCVKRGQHVPVSFSSPSLLVESGLRLSGGRF
ncbi:metallopeptidase TldD-related protein [Kitasatospora sp. NPDC097691]|uniref:TldD/PmbA family protein n=1 Tax=Kitasatospora sp. NPDC097691 TaxID=3157231 RepID=UPI00332DD3B9